MTSFNFKRPLPKKLSRAGTLSVLTMVLIIVAASSLSSSVTQAQGQTILNIVLHDSYGKPLSGVKCEVLSYDWGLERGKPYSVIAQGETDRNGVIAFDSTIWPHSGYRFKFSPTDHTQPTSTFFMPPAQNQYRGFPAAATGGVSQTVYFAIGADGLAYNDLSSGQGSPTFEKDPVGGMNQPRVSPQDMSAQNFLATARAATATAFAEGVPTLTPPPPAQPFRGVAGPLTITPQAQQLTPGPTPASPSPGPAGAAANPPASTTTPQPTAQAITTIQPSNQPAQQPAQNDPYPLLLAVFGLTCLFTFWVYRHRIYHLLGLDVALIPELPTTSKRKKVKPTKPAKAKAKKGQSSKPTVTANSQTLPAAKVQPGQTEE